MKKITLTTLVVAMITLTTNSFAGNWTYTGTGTKWIKNITPEMLQFNKQNTSSVQSKMFINGGAANPSPLITSTSGQDLTNGYFVITGGQITGATAISNVTKGFVIPDTATFAPGSLRFAAASSIINDGGKIGVTGYVNLNWYVPTNYNRTGYSLQVSDSIYTSAGVTITFTTYDEADALKYTQVTSTASGWKNLTVAQTGAFVPFRVKLGLPNTSNLIAYINTPRFELLSASEPATRSVTVTTTADGVVTPTFGNLHDQDVETFSITTIAGKVIDAVTFNGATVTTIKNGNAYYYTTPLLTANATLAVTYKNDTGVGTSNTEAPSFIVSNKGGFLQVDGLVAGQIIDVFAFSGKHVFHSIATQSSSSISLSKGVYLVKINEKVSKVIL